IARESQVVRGVRVVAGALGSGPNRLVLRVEQHNLFDAHAHFLPHRGAGGSFFRSGSVFSHSQARWAAARGGRSMIRLGTARARGGRIPDGGVDTSEPAEVDQRSRRPQTTGRRSTPSPSGG